MHYIKIRSNTLHYKTIYTIYIQEGGSTMVDNNNRELKPTSIRVDEGTGKKLKELVKGFPNQNEALRKLIETYELQQSKAVIGDKQAFITQFEEYSSCMVNMYIQSLEDNQNLREMVQEEFNTLILSKDKIIQDLQGQLENARQQAGEALQKAEALQQEKSSIGERLQENMAKINEMKSSMSDKDGLNKALSERCDSLEQQARAMEKDCKAMAEAQAKCEGYERTIADLKNHETDIQIKNDKALLEIERKYQTEINKIKKENQKEIDKYQKKYFELLENIKFTKSKESIIPAEE